MYFSAIAPPAIDSIIQPTLQYGVSAAGGGPFWSIATWFITGDTAYVTNLTEVSGSRTLVAFFSNEDEFLGTPTTHFWASGFATDLALMNVETLEVFNVALEVLEITDAIEIANLPNEPTGIEQIFILTEEEVSLLSIPWTLENDPADGIIISPTALVQFLNYY